MKPFATAWDRTVAASFVGVGVAAAVISGLLLLRFDPAFCQGIGYAVGLAGFMVVDGRWASPSSGDKGRWTAFFMLGAAIGYAGSLALLSAITKRSGFNIYLAQLAAGVVFLLLTIILNLIVFGCLVTRPREIRQSIDWLFRPALGRVVFAAAIIVFAVIDLGAVWNLSKSMTERASTQTNDRVPQWIKSAECFKKTGIIFVICDNSDKLIPIEDASTADDRGHGLLLSVLHKWFAIPASKDALVVINAAINLVGFALLALQLYRFGYRIAGIGFFVGAVPFVRDSVVNADVNAACFGLFALSLLLPLQILRQFSIERQSAIEWLWLLGSGFLLVAVMMMREPFGSIVLLISVSALVVCAICRIRTIRLRHLVVICISLGSLWLAAHGTELLIKYRVMIQDVHTGTGVLTHGIAHNLFIGLGAEPNTLGIEWSDTSAANFVKSIDPTIPYGSPKYFDVLSRAYIDLVIRHPIEIGRIYASKAAKILTPRFAIWLVLTIALIMVALALHRLEFEKYERKPPLEAVCAVGVVATLLHTAQGILTVPSSEYFTQANIGLVLMAALAADVWFETIWGKTERAGNG